MADVRYTPIGDLNRWKPWAGLEAEPKLLWLGLYTSQTALRCVPGLWTGTIYGMSDDSGLSPNATLNALDVLVDRKLAAFDQENRVARLTVLPDTLARAHNDKAISGWWTRFITIPAIPLRDAHIPLLWKMVQNGNCSPTMVTMWAKTFGSISVPDHVAPYQPLRISDTGTVVQPSLFSSAGLPISKINNSGGPRVLPGTSTGRPDPDPDLDLDLDPDPEGRPRLALVPSPSAQDVAKGARSAYAAEMFAAVEEAGGASLGLVAVKETT